MGVSPVPVAAGSSNCTTPFLSSVSLWSASDTLIWYSSGCDSVTSAALIQPVESLGRVGRYTCSQSWYWSNTRKLTGSVYSVFAFNVCVGCALASGVAYTATSPPLVTAFRNGAAAYDAEMPLEFATCVGGRRLRCGLVGVVAARGDEQPGGRDDEQNDDEADEGNATSLMTALAELGTGRDFVRHADLSVPTVYRALAGGSGCGLVEQLLERLHLQQEQS